MANYIKKSLEPGEEIIYTGRMHWTCIWKYLTIAYLLAPAGLLMAIYGYMQNDTSYYIMAIVALVLSIAIWTWGYILRTRTEFVITGSRFIQKDGILSIKMTEIPLQRVETVNFYQNIIQRMFGTGCIELVGSGGTSHQVHFIEHPMQVRKIIVGTIGRTERPTPPTTEA